MIKYPLQKGFTLIELIVFIVIMAIMGLTIATSMQMTLRKTPDLQNNLMEHAIAQGCIEGFLAQRKIFGFNYAFLAVGNPIPAGNLPCTFPAGYTVTAVIANFTLNTDPNYKSISVTVSGKNTTTFGTIIANY